VEGQRLGITIGSLASVSLEPPLVCVAIGVHSPLHTPLQAAGRCAVSVLGGDQEHLAQHFARNVPPIALWEGVPLHASEWPEPLLADALAWLECGVVATYPAGDHTLFVGEVLTAELGRDAPGLAYVGGRYRAA
jgi:flavin reductase (DIM6/NTAB) family NADH-FMN oxidoreductase RutF